MKKLFLLCSVITFTFSLMQTGFTQVMNCAGSKTGAGISFLEQNGTEILLDVRWDEGAGFGHKSALNITNGTCVDCPNLGSLDVSKRVKNAVYKVKQTDSSIPVIIAWGATSSRYCGTSSMTIGGKNTLNMGETLAANASLISANGAYMLRMQAEDGNLCIYKVANGKQGEFVWCSMEYGFSNSKLVMQADGNLVVYDGSNKPHWASKTMAHFDQKWGQAANKPVKAVLENNGKLNLYNAAGTVVWTNQ